MEKDGEEMIIFARPNKDNTVSFGVKKRELLPYSLEKKNKPNVNLEDDTNSVLDTTIFKAGIATYSGIIKNFDEKSTEKTGMIHVNNIFTGDQDSHLININHDGTFSVSFPCYHLERVYVEFPKIYSALYVAPGKTTWHFVNSSNRSEGFFAGDLKQLNTDIVSLNGMLFDHQDYSDNRNNIKNITPQAYKATCFNIQKKQLLKLDSISRRRFLSRKAYEIMRNELIYRSYENILSYDMYNGASYKDSANVTVKYIKFITPEVLNNKSAVETSSYSSFINRLKFLKHFREGISVTYPNFMELANIIKNQGVTFTDDEMTLIEMYKTYNKENAEAIKRSKEFNDKYKEVASDINKKYTELYTNMSEEERKKYFGKNRSLEEITKYIKQNNLDIVFTEAEKEYRKESENLWTKEEKKRAELFFSEENKKKNRAFNDKYKSYIDKYIHKELDKQGIEKYKENLGETFSTDVIIAQEILGTLINDYIPFSESELIEAKKEVKNAFVANVINIENDKLMAKIEANKTKTGAVFNTTSNKEADKIFETIISKYKGKVVFVDFWATWCGPCRSGIKKMKPFKELYKDEEVVFVYISSPSSPEATYNNMIPDIKGEHYRVSKDEWNYLKSKFNISGIPHYLLVNKEGEVVKQNTSDLRSPESLKPILDSYLEKE